MNLRLWNWDILPIILYESCWSQNSLILSEALSALCPGSDVEVPEGFTSRMDGGSKFYRLFSTPTVDYAGAMINCQSFGGNLAMPKTREELDDLDSVRGNGCNDFIALSKVRTVHAYLEE